MFFWNLLSLESTPIRLCVFHHMVFLTKWRGWQPLQVIARFQIMTSLWFLAIDNPLFFVFILSDVFRFFVQISNFNWSGLGSGLGMAVGTTVGHGCAQPFWNLKVQNRVIQKRLECVPKRCKTVERWHSFPLHLIDTRWPSIKCQRWWFSLPVFFVGIYFHINLLRNAFAS